MPGPTPPQPAVSPPVRQFCSTAADLAGRLGLTVLVVVRDPATRAVHFVGTPGALENMKPEIAVKVAGADEEAVTGWGEG